MAKNFDKVSASEKRLETQTKKTAKAVSNANGSLKAVTVQLSQVAQQGQATGQHLKLSPVFLPNAGAVLPHGCRHPRITIDIDPPCTSRLTGV